MTDRRTNKYVACHRMVKARGGFRSGDRLSDHRFVACHRMVKAKGGFRSSDRPSDQQI